MDPVIWAALIAVGGVSITAIVGLLVKMIDKRHTVESQFRKDKADMFIGFMEAFDKIFYDQGQSKKNTVDKALFKSLLKTRREMIVWCSVDTIARFDEIKEFASDPKYPPNTVGHLYHTMQLYSELLIALRRDLGLPSKGLDSRTFALRLLLRRPELAIEEFNKDPLTTIEDLSTIEKEVERNH